MYIPEPIAVLLITWLCIWLAWKYGDKIPHSIQDWWVDVCDFCERIKLPTILGWAFGILFIGVWGLFILTWIAKIFN